MPKLIHLTKFSPDKTVYYASSFFIQLNENIKIRAKSLRVFDPDCFRPEDKNDSDECTYDGIVQSISVKNSKVYVTVRYYDRSTFTHPLCCLLDPEVGEKSSWIYSLQPKSPPVEGERNRYLVTKLLPNTIKKGSVCAVLDGFKARTSYFLKKNGYTPLVFQQDPLTAMHITSLGYQTILHKLGTKEDTKLLRWIPETLQSIEALYLDFCGKISKVKVKTLFPNLKVFGVTCFLRRVCERLEILSYKEMLKRLGLEQKNWFPDRTFHRDGILTVFFLKTPAAAEEIQMPNLQKTVEEIKKLKKRKRNEKRRQNIHNPHPFPPRKSQRRRRRLILRMV